MNPLRIAALFFALLHGLPRPAKRQPNPVEVVHRVPGRLRLALHGLKRQPRRARRVERAIAGLPGVTAASASPCTGRVLIQYDPRRTSAEWLTMQIELGWPPVADEEA